MHAEFEQALKAANVKYERFQYPGTQHGFHNDTTPRYNEAAAKLAWQRTVAFFDRVQGRTRSPRSGTES
ncbi:MAG TPA: dienelactone hydrolase family protein [Gemmatimonadaceae bacterium]|nr:dienelactone hydrolase family protein [Gemmatimonadaceae bacterium]